MNDSSYWEVQASNPGLDKKEGFKIIFMFGHSLVLKPYKIFYVSINMYLLDTINIYCILYVTYDVIVLFYIIFIIMNTFKKNEYI